MQNSLRFLALAFVAAVSGVAACTATTTETEQNPPADGGADARTTKDSGTTGLTDSGTETSEDPDQACAAEATSEACQECCTTNHQKGAGAMTTAIIACACKGEGSTTDAGEPVCATECASTLCAAQPANPDATCSACLDKAIAKDGPCLDSVADACRAEPDCMAAQECVVGCPGQ